MLNFRNFGLGLDMDLQKFPGIIVQELKATRIVCFYALFANNLSL